MLPTPIDLRELSERFLQAAEKVPEAAMKSRLASHALLLAQVADQLEREIRFGASAPAANIERFERALTNALDRETRTIVEQLLKEERENIRAKLEEIARWRLRSQELRMVADECQLPSAQEMLLRAAANYDRLAEQAEARFRGHGTSAGPEAC